MSVKIPGGRWVSPDGYGIVEARILLVLAVLVGTLVLACSSPGGPTPNVEGTEEREKEIVLKQESNESENKTISEFGLLERAIEAYRHNDGSEEGMREYYRYLTPASRNKCTEEEFVQGAMGLTSFFIGYGVEYEIKVLGASEDGDIGTVDVTWVVENEEPTPKEKEWWKRVDGTWWDSSWETAGCESSTSKLDLETPTPIVPSTKTPSAITKSGEPIPVPRFLNKSYIAADGLEVELKSLTSSVNGNVISIAISYSLSNPTLNLITEGSWKLYYTDGSGLPQYGGFGELIPGQRLERSYTFNVPSLNKPWYVGYPSRFFTDWEEEDLLWNINTSLDDTERDYGSYINGQELRVNPNTVSYGDEIAITLQGMPSKFTIPETAVTLGGNWVAIPGYKENAETRPKTDEDGTVTFNIFVPNEARRGLQYLRVYIPGIFEARNEVVVQAIPVSLSSTSAVPYQKIWVMSKGFASTSDSGESSNRILGSRFLDSLDVGGKKVNSTYVDLPIVLGAGGATFFELTVPKDTDHGSVELRIIDTDGRIGSAIIDVPDPQMSGHTAIAYPGETVNFSLTGFVATNLGLDIKNYVEMKYVYTTNKTGSNVTAIDIGTFDVDETGRVNGSFITPKSALLSSSNTVMISPRYGEPLEVAHYISGRKIHAEPESGLPYDLVEISLKGLPANYRFVPGSIQMAGIRMLFDNESSLVSDDVGKLTLKGRVPSGLMAGTHSIDWYPPGGSKISEDFEVTEGKLNVRLSPAVPGQEVTVISEGFANISSPSDSDSTNISITGSGDSYVSIEGVQLRHDSIDYPVTLNKNGEFQFDLNLPVEGALGKDTLELTTFDSAGRTAKGSVDLKRASIAVTPSISQRGTNIEIIGNGFIANTKAETLREEVLVEYGGTSIGTVYPDSEGAFSFAFMVPASAKSDTSHTITATHANFSSVKAYTTHTVPAAEIKVTPQTALPGSKVKVIGTGLPARRQVTIGIGHLWAVPPPVFYTDYLGNFEQIITVPHKSEAGTVDLKVYVPYPIESGRATFHVGVGQSAQDVPVPTPVPTPVLGSIEPDITRSRLLSKQYIAPDGLEIMLLSLSKTVTGNVASIRITYSLSNPTPDLILEGSWKLDYAGGGGRSQTGFFNNILPDDKVVRSYTFNVQSPAEPSHLTYQFLSRNFGGYTSTDLIWDVD